jgi:hypothetical protein
MVARDILSRYRGSFGLYFLAALGVYGRDLAQVNGFLLTLHY